MKVMVEPDLLDHPKLHALAKTLKIGRFTAAGHLISLWCYAIRYRLDGDLNGLDNAQISKAAGWEDDTGIFVTALRSPDHRWLDGYKIHDWHEHQGKYIAKIMQSREWRRSYMRDYRAAKAMPRPPREVDAQEVDGYRPQATKEPLPRYGKDPCFESVSDMYPGIVDAAVARVVWERLSPSEADISEMLEALKPENMPISWKEDGGRFIPSLSNWLAKYGWKNRPGKAIESDAKTPF